MSTVEAVASHRASREQPPSVEIVVPAYNEEAELEASILRLRWFLDTSFPFDATVTVADNASTDRTWEIAAGLARRVPGVRAVHLAEKGRGRALRAAWMASDATVVAYMDVDLATGLDALLPLVAPLLSGHSDVAIGTRLARGSRVVRGPKRELISRGYNLVVRAALHNGFSDAQCGFKAVRTDVARVLLPMVEDETWFFDTELLVLAERHALRIHEVPVDWTDDPDSRVDIRQTALDDLRGVWRLMRSRSTRTRGPAVPPRPSVGDRTRAVPRWPGSPGSGSSAPSPTSSSTCCSRARCLSPPVWPGWCGPSCCGPGSSGPTAGRLRQPQRGDDVVDGRQRGDQCDRRPEHRGGVVGRDTGDGIGRHDHLVAEVHRLDAQAEHAEVDRDAGDDQDPDAEVAQRRVERRAGERRDAVDPGS